MDGWNLAGEVGGLAMGSIWRVGKYRGQLSNSGVVIGQAASWVLPSSHHSHEPGVRLPPATFRGRGGNHTSTQVHKYPARTSWDDAIHPSSVPQVRPNRLSFIKRGGLNECIPVSPVSLHGLSPRRLSILCRRWVASVPSFYVNGVFLAGFGDTDRRLWLAWPRSRDM